jgi:hypothetical protein
MAKDTTPKPNEANAVVGTGEGNTEATVAKTTKAEKKYFLTLEIGIDSHQWVVVLPNSETPNAYLTAGERTEVSKEVFEFMNTPYNNPDIYNPQTKRSVKRFKAEVE